MPLTCQFEQRKHFLKCPEAPELTAISDCYMDKILRFTVAFFYYWVYSPQLIFTEQMKLQSKPWNKEKN